jgi:hypothetical protein
MFKVLSSSPRVADSNEMIKIFGRIPTGNPTLSLIYLVETANEFNSINWRLDKITNEALPFYPSMTATNLKALMDDAVD